jgi:integrase/recombinase XerD
MTNALTVTTPTQGLNAGSYSLVSRDSTDEQVVRMWLQSGKRANSTATQDVYRRVWRDFSAFVGRPLQDVTLDVLQDWTASLAGKPATVRTKLAAIKSLFSFCVKIGYLRMSPAAMLQAPHVPQNVSAHVVSVADLARILDACQTAQECALVRTLYSSGARISEVLALRWQDVTERSDGAGAHLFIASGKGRKSRTAGVNAATYDALLALREEDTQPEDFVFSTRTGRPLDRHAAHRMLKRLLRRAGVKDSACASCHWLRHSHATHALAQGANIADVQAQLGHSSLNTTSLYAHAGSYSADKLPL